MTHSFKSSFLVQIISTDGKIRGTSLLEDLSAQNVNFHLVEGVVPKESEYSNGVLHSYVLSKIITTRKMKIGEVGCALAHQKCANNLIDSESLFGIVLEDDAEIIRKFEFDQLTIHLDSEEPRIVILGWIPGFAIALKQSTSEPKMFAKLATPTTCTFAYALNKPAAKLIINNHSKIIDLADWPIYILNKTDFFIVPSPWVTASHDPENSTIGIRTSTNYNSVVFRIFNMFRIIANTLTLIIFSKIFIIKVSIKQILHRMIFRDLIFKFGNREIAKYSEFERPSKIVLSSKSIQKIAEFLN